MITLENQTDGLYFYSELLSSSFVEGNPYLFTLTDQLEKSNTYDVVLDCTLVDGYISVFKGDLSVITTGKNFFISIENTDTLESLRVLRTA